MIKDAIKTDVINARLFLLNKSSQIGNALACTRYGSHLSKLMLA